MKLMRLTDHYKWLLGSAICAGLVCYFIYGFLSTQKPEFMTDIFKVFIPLYGILLGFLLTLLTIVVSLIGNSFIKNLMKSGHYQNLVENSKVLALLYFFSIILSVLGLFIKDDQTYVFVLVIFLSLVLVIFSLRTAYKYFQVFTHIGKSVK